ncbi:MAG: hypothetical protein R6X19_09545 [Kiritimatiellia bacterium]
MDIRKTAGACWMVAVVVFGACAFAADIYVAPEGTAKGRGSAKNPIDIFTAVSAESPARPGDRIWLKGGVYEGRIVDNSRQPFDIRVSGAADKPVVIQPAPGESVRLDGTVAFYGNYTHVIGLDIGDSRWGQKGHRQSTAVDAFAGKSSKIINCNIFGGAMGTGIWGPAIDFEIYGCMIHDFGYRGEGRGHGHSYYSQNREGTKRLTDSIHFNGYGWNLHAYSESGWVQGYHVEGNIIFSPGMLQEDPPKDNIWFGSRNPMDRITIISNVVYHPERGGSRPNVRLTTQRDKNIAGKLKDNYIMGLRGLDVQSWQKMEITGNTIWGPDRVLNVAAEKGDEWTVDNNTYIAPDNARLFNGKTFKDYRAATGFDENSTLIDAARPTGNFIFIRPNRYEKGRGHVAIFNWKKWDSVAVDLSGVLKKGAKFVVYNVQDLRGAPVVRGVFDGKPVKFPMLRSEIAPDFDAFLVRTMAEK